VQIDHSNKKCRARRRGIVHTWYQKKVDVRKTGKDGFNGVQKAGKADLRNLWVRGGEGEGGASKKKSLSK